MIEIRGSGKLLRKWITPCERWLFPECHGVIKMFELRNTAVTFYARTVPFDDLGSADIADGKAIIAVYLSNHKDRPSARRTVLHELYHVYQLQNGRPVSEREAELFAWQGIISN